MGGLRLYMPVTFVTYAVGMMALCGVPFFFSGFWSKDEILHEAFLWKPSLAPFCLGIFGALLTAFYMTRQVCYVFFGHSRDTRTSFSSSGLAYTGPHESPPMMTWPLIILAAFAVLLSLIGTPFWPWFQTYLSGRAATGGFHWETLFVMLLSILIVALGLGGGWWLYGRKPAKTAEAPDPLEEISAGAFDILANKFFVDELYEATVVRLNAQFSRFCHWLDSVALDTLVLMVSYLVVGLSWLNRVIDEYVINSGFDEACKRTRNGGGFLSRLQDGQVQNYLRVLGLSLTVLLLLTWGCGK
jgi:NADH-quinone oxidoreductase subunit L